MAGRAWANPSVESTCCEYSSSINCFLYCKGRVYKSKHAQLNGEAQIIKKLQGEVDIPLLHWYEPEAGCNVMVIDLLGPSLADPFNLCNRNSLWKLFWCWLIRWSLELNSCIPEISSTEISNQTISWSAFKINLILFIWSTLVWPRNIEIVKPMGISYRENKNLTGTARYASINAHLGIEQSRRDDWSLFAMCLYTCWKDTSLGRVLRQITDNKSIIRL